MHKFSKWFFIPAILAVMYGCGGGGGTSINLSPEISIDLQNLPAGVDFISASEVTVEIGTVFSAPDSSATDPESGNLSSIIVIESNVDLSTPGTYSITYSVTDNSSNITEKVLTVRVIDTTPPVLTLNAGDNVNHPLNSNFIDPGVVITDNSGEDLSAALVVTSTVDTSTLGTYSITYSVTDNSSNTNQETLTVHVIDTIPPVLTLNGGDYVNHPLGFDFIDPGVVITENSGEDLSSALIVTGTVNTSTAAEYTLTYNVQDSSNNAATPITRTVNVYDTGDLPVILLNGSSVINIDYGLPYNDAGATAFNKDGLDISASLVIESTVDISIPGSYTVTYNVQDSTGLDAFEVIRTVNVVDTIVPTLAVSTPVVEVCSPIGTGKIARGLVASDNTDENLFDKITILSSIDFNTVATHENLVVQVADISGNTAEITTDVRVGICYDIIYVRYPAVESPTNPFVNISQGEQPYEISPGADLVLLREDGSQQVLVDCETCSVMDPFISYDAKWVYYSLTIDADTTAPSSFIYKINLEDPLYSPVQMTFDNGFHSSQYAGNTEADDDLAVHNNIMDFAPVPLADGRLLFTSNRSALMPFHLEARVYKSMVQQMFTMDDHNGTAITPELANMRILEHSTVHMVQHPMQLKDGRIMFSWWHDAGTKFKYAMTNLMTINPDGTNLQQFTEPHEHHKNLDHFITQITSGDIISGFYYPSFDYGYGLLLRLPLDPGEPGAEMDFQRDPIDQKHSYVLDNGNSPSVSFREYDRIGTLTITPHTESLDVPAPDYSGKYSMPSSGLFNNLLVAYSTGSVNWFNAVCNPDQNDGVDLCESLKSGIYLIKDAAGDVLITDPNQLIQIKDDPAYNEIWPRAVVSYQELHGQEKPMQITNSVESGPQDDRLDFAEAASMMGTSSMFNRELLNERVAKLDRFTPISTRELHNGNWTIQGADAGVFDNSEIHAVRIIATPPVPFTSPLSNSSESNTDINRYLLDHRLSIVPRRFGAYHGERWEILGEFPLSHKLVTDGQGNPDSSWLAKIPSDMPTFIQTLDDKGMTLTSELTWRALKPGENRSDCGGCHAHSIPMLDFSTTETGKRIAIQDVEGIANEDPRIQQGYWDLTSGSIPMLTQNGTEFVSASSVGVEFFRDVNPILQGKCVSCHTALGTGNMMILDGVGYLEDAWAVLSETKNPDDYPKISHPQRSRYIRIPQARQSMLAWVVWGERLDGRTNADRDDDLDYSDAMHDAHTVTVDNLTDLEKRTISRWIDLGGPVDYPVTEGFGYTEDYHLPTINIASPLDGSNAAGSSLIIGFSDSHSGLDMSTLSIEYYPAAAVEPAGIDASTNIAEALADVAASISGNSTPIPIDISTQLDSKNVVTRSLPGELSAGTEYIIRVSVKDNAGNIGIEHRRFLLN